MHNNLRSVNVKTFEHVSTNDLHLHKIDMQNINIDNYVYNICLKNYRDFTNLMALCTFYGNS
jgi:hypothetical protein